ncbi:MAG: PfkB family carbohydrate kinase [Pseudomonadota bacterium]
MRVVFVGAAHVDRIGHFTDHAETGLSTPGTMSETLGGAALNTVRTVAAHGLDTVLHCLTAFPALERLAAAEGFALAPQQSRTTGEDIPHIETPSYTAFLQPDGSLLAALSDMAAYEHLLPKLDATKQRGWLCLDANLSSSALVKLAQVPATMRIGLAVSAAKASRLTPILKKLDLLFCSRAEVAALLNLTADHPTVSQLADGLRDLGVGAAVITDGSNPITIVDQTDIETVTPPPLTQKPISVVGAGDGLAGGTIAALTLGCGLRDAVCHGVACAQTALFSADAVAVETLIAVAKRDGMMANGRQT